MELRKWIRSRLSNPRTEIGSGMMLLAVALVTTHYLPRWPGMQPDRADLISGFVMGLAIGVNLVIVIHRLSVGRLRRGC